MLLIIDYRRYLVILLGISIGITIRGCRHGIQAQIQVLSVILPGKASQLCRYLSSPYFVVNPSIKEDKESALKICQRNNTRVELESTSYDSNSGQRFLPA